MHARGVKYRKRNSFGGEASEVRDPLADPIVAYQRYLSLSQGNDSSEAC